MPAPRGALDKSFLETLVDEDLSVRAIALRTNRSFTTVRYWLREYDLETSPAARRLAPPGGHRGWCDHHGETAMVSSGGRFICGRCRVEAVSAWRRRAKLLLVAEAGGGCAICGYDRCVAALQFHHVDPGSKQFGLSARGLSRSIERLREEASKCVLLCGNCHVEVEVGIATLPPSGRTG